MLAATLLESVLFVIVNVPSLIIPPPRSLLAELLEIVLFVIVNVPLFSMPPPSP